MTGFGAAGGAVAIAVVVALAVSAAVTAQAPAAGAARPRPQATGPQGRPATGPEGPVLREYCVGCHNERTKTAGFVMDPASLDDVGRHPEVWEKVVKKLRTRAMPPPGARRPDEKTYDAVASRLEGELDRAAAARPQLGSVPLAHRLSRTEYGHAVRDLLALDALPREVGIDLLLPPDNVSSGFDNLADLLFVSPSTMERYLDAARKISRLAVGDPQMPVLVNIHRLNPEHPQDERVEELPFGTRGGLAIRSEFPVEGT